MNVLTQIGLGYPFLFLFRNRKFAVQLTAAAMILGGYWAWFALTPVVVVENPKEINLPENWKLLQGFEAHWQKNANPAATFDRWLLNQFPAASPAPAVQGQSPAPPNTQAETDEAKPKEVEPPNWIARFGQVARRLVTRPEPYVFNNGGYQTTNFIPAFVTMLFGLMAGEFIRRVSIDRRRTFVTLVIAGILLLGIGWGLNALGYCPLVKRIWTPGWTLFSTGWTLLMLAGFYGIIDGLGWKAWSFPLIVAGMNSMVLYMSGQLLRGWT